jgi:PAS domain S-box-containing protein
MIAQLVLLAVHGWLTSEPLAPKTSPFTSEALLAHCAEASVSSNKINILKPQGPFHSSSTSRIERVSLQTTGFIKLSWVFYKGKAMNETVGPLYEQRQWLQVTLSSIGDAVITTDAESRVTFLNPVAQALTGWDQQDAAGVPLEVVFRIINQETRGTVENPATRALREGLVVGLANHTLLIAKNGTERAIDDSAAPIRNDNGVVVGVVLVFRDVTDRRKAEEALRESEERFRLLVEGVHDYAIFMLDPKGNITTWNAGAERIKGYTAEEIVGKHFSCFYPQEAIEAGWPELELQSATAHGRFEDEGWRLRKDGSKLWANVIITRLRDDNGDLKGFSKITRDLTERMRKESELREREVRFRRLFESAKDGILILDSSTGRITEANPFMTELLGCSTDELIGKQLWEIGLLKDREGSEAAFRQLQEQGYIRYDLVLQTKDGRTLDVESISNVYNVNHQSVIQCNIRDITERRQMERAQAQAEALTELHRRKDEFLATLSHEIRNPLAAITNAIDLLDFEKHEDPTQAKATGIIRRQVNNLVVLVDELLEVSRLLSNRIQLHLEDLDISGIVQKAVETARPVISQPKHELTVLLPPDDIWVHADAIRLEEVIVNLLTNAAKYTPADGHIWLNIQKEGDEAVLSIRDDGIGIEPDFLPQIFDLFAQAQRSLDRSQGGLGVGLTLVRKLVQMHGGTIEAHSEGLGQGSQFIVRLPVLSSRIVPVPIPVIERSKISSPARRVLVVDDNQDTADSIAMLLARSGHEVKVAYSAKKALEAATEYQPEVVVLDIGLPEMDGYEVARRLRLDSRLRSVKLIALTGYGQESDFQRSKEAGFDYHLVKPVELEKIEELLTK